jgi:cytochrome c peroxidase
MIPRAALPVLGAVALLAGVVAPQLAGAQAPALVAAASSGDPVRAARFALGRRLFYDGDLSIDGSMACATCHLQHHGFAESNRTHPGVTDEPGRRNVPGLANVARRRSFTWADSTLRTLEAQALVPIFGEHPVEMGMKGQEAELVRRLGRNACYPRLFRAAFPQEEGRIDTGTVARALAEFERGLVSADAPADRFERGEAAAISPLARDGRAQFRKHCAACHAGPDLTDDRFHRVEAVDARDPGLGAVTGMAADMGRFRTPSLRNVAVSAPYFHDGETQPLSAAIRRHGGLALGPAQETSLLAYLGELTDPSFLTDPRFAYPDGPCEVP